ncbi:hypothetical protein BaRGS_00034512 [Batillaria attramentaria]|uniref:Uncharacterized protein n=1 Tax=Batillaria attramentaria TaxID=370345 RepID=A0ABD0JHF0_9CAEN
MFPSSLHERDFAIILSTQVKSLSKRGAFLIPYLVAVILGGVPMFFLEVTLGQFMSEGGIGPWKIAPLFQGIGYATTIIVFLLNCEYNIILTWALYYIFSSFNSVLPWSHCNNEWNTPNCSTFDEVTPPKTNTSLTATAANATVIVAETWGMENSSYVMVDIANVTTNMSRSVMDPVTEFWERKVLALSSGVGEPGSIKWDLALCLLLAWIIVYFCIWKGIKSSGKDPQGQSSLVFWPDLSSSPFLASWLSSRVLLSPKLQSQFVGVEGFITSVVDFYPTVLRRGYRREIFIAIVCVISFFIGLSMVTEGGMYVFQLFDYYSASRIVLVVAFFECITVSYVYGVNRFYENLEMMFGFRMGPVMKVCWMVLTPIYTVVIFVMGCVSYSDLTYKRKTVLYEYPSWAIAIGWMLASMSVIFIPIIMVYKILASTGSLAERVKHLIKPRLRRHQLCSNEDLSRVILEEDTFFSDLDMKVEGGSGIGDSLLSVPPDYAPYFEKPSAPTDVFLQNDHIEMEKKDIV